MSAPNPQRALQVAGRLVLGPTNGGMLAGVYPWGGTPVGLVTKFALVRTNQVASYNSEARGVDGAALYRGRERAGASFVLIQYDTAIINMISASNTTSPNGFSGANTLSLPQPGRNLAPGLVAQGSPLLFGADDPSHPSLLIFAPQWSWEGKLVLDRTLVKGLEFGLSVVCGLDANGYDYREDAMENLQL